MNVVLRALLVTTIMATAFSLCGCAEGMHNLQPHRLHQLNRGPGMPTGPEAYSMVGAIQTHV